MPGVRKSLSYGKISFVVYTERGLAGREDRKKEDQQKFNTHDVELQMSRSICAEIQEEDKLREPKVEIEKIVRQLCNWKQVKNS